MTVIAWDGKVLAADSLISSTDGFNGGKCKKLYRLKSGGMLGIAGDVDVRAVLLLLDSIKDGDDLPTRAELEATKTDGQYLLVLPDKSVWDIVVEYSDDLKAYKAEVSENKARAVTAGHGKDYAHAAMALGKSSVEAVKFACKHSLYCGGPVQTMKLEDKPKEKINRKRKPAQVAEE
jgi:hypothetical protein